MTKDTRPNILLIMTDQQSASAMSCTGNPHLRTPAMDSLSVDGMRFEKAYCCNPICVPSRTSMFTGLMCHQTGVMNNDAKTVEAGTCLGRLLREAGYATGYTGKWHIPHKIWDQEWSGFDFLSSVGNHNVDSTIPDSCAEFMAVAENRPFFLVASFVNPHDVCQLARRIGGMDDKLPEGDIDEFPPIDQCPPLPMNFEIPDDEPEAVRLHQMHSKSHERVYPTHNWGETEWRRYLWGSCRIVEKVDREISRLLDALRQKGLDQDTVIIFTSDHGDGMGAHRWNQKTVLYDEVVRVPFIMRQTGTIKGDVVDTRALINTGIDLATTCLGIAGVPVPVELKGQDLYAYARGLTEKTHSFVVSQTDLLFTASDSGKGVSGRMLRSSRYKYIVYNCGDKTEQLFDLDSDHGEVHNLAGQPEAAPILDSHREMLEKWLRENGDKFK